MAATPHPPSCAPLTFLPTAIITRIFDFLPLPRTQKDWDDSGNFRAFWQQAEQESGTPQYAAVLSIFRRRRDAWLREDTMPLEILALGRSVQPTTATRAASYISNQFIDKHAFNTMWNRAKSERGLHLMATPSRAHDDEIRVRFRAFKAQWDRLPAYAATPRLAAACSPPPSQKRPSETDLDEPLAKRRVDVDRWNPEVDVATTPPAQRCLLSAFQSAAHGLEDQRGSR